jgi:microcystin-dependent protein
VSLCNVGDCSRISDRTIRDVLSYAFQAINQWASVEHDPEGHHTYLDNSLMFVPVGSMVDFAGTTAPNGWLLCDGGAVSRITYKALFNTIGTSYGNGDGVLTFNLPDYRGRFPLGKTAAGTGSTLGATGGQLDHTHEVGAHTHSLSLSTGSNGGFSTSTGTNGSHSHSVTASGDTSEETGFDAQSGSGADRTATHTHTVEVSGSTNSAGDHNHSVSVSDHTHTISGSTGSASGGTTDGANPPYLVANKIIFTGVALNA